MLSSAACCHLRHVALLKQVCTSTVSVDHLKILMDPPLWKKARTEASSEDESGTASDQVLLAVLPQTRSSAELVAIPDESILASAEQPAAVTRPHKNPGRKSEAPKEIVIIPDEIHLEDIWRYLEDLRTIWKAETSHEWMQQIKKCIRASAKQFASEEGTLEEGTQRRSSAGEAVRACEQQPVAVNSSDSEHSILSVSDEEALEGSEHEMTSRSRHEMTSRMKRLALRRLPVYKKNSPKKSKSMRQQLAKSLNGKLTKYSPKPAESLEEMWTRIVTHWRTAIGPLSWRMRCLISLISDASKADPELLQGLKEALRTARCPLNTDAEMMLWCRELLSLGVIE